MGYSSEQLKNAEAIVEGLRRRGKANPKRVLGSIQTALVESNLKNLNHGDRDSLGLFQQRPSQGWGTPEQVRNIDYATGKFSDAWDRYDAAGLSAGEVAARVQRPAAEYRGRYAQRRGDAMAVLKQIGAEGLVTGGKKKARGGAAPTVSGDRKESVLNFLGKKNPSLNDVVAVVAAKKAAANQVPTRQKSISSQGKVQGGVQEILQDIGARAKKLGLNVGEHKDFGGVAPVHSKNSWHYQNRALDISGDQQKMSDLAVLIEKLYGRQLKELFYDGGRGNVNRKNGEKVKKDFVPNHHDHIHVAR